MRILEYSWEYLHYWLVAAAVDFLLIWFFFSKSTVLLLNIPAIAAIVPLMAIWCKSKESEKGKKRNYEVWFSCGLAVALLGIWVPGLILENRIYNELDEISLTQANLDSLIVQLRDSIESGDASDLEKRLNNIDRLKSFPIKGSDGDKIGYGFSVYYENVGKEKSIRIPAVCLYLVLMWLLSVRFVFNNSSNRSRKRRLITMAMIILLCGGAVPLWLSGMKVYYIAFVGFYAALFSWCYEVKEYGPERKFPTDSKEVSAEQAEAMCSYYSNMMRLAFTIFGAVTIGLTWYISQHLTSNLSICKTTSTFHLLMVLGHDIYGTMIMIAGVVFKLEEHLAATISKFPEKRNTYHH